ARLDARACAPARQHTRAGGPDRGGDRFAALSGCLRQLPSRQGRVTLRRLSL
ncbi:uncharacterized protein METZ01_LOCUS264831, partial [marine metagenome]